MTDHQVMDVLTPDRLLEQARDAVHLDDFGSDEAFHEGLNRLLKSVRTESRLTVAGVEMARMDMLRLLLEVAPPECEYWQFHLTSQFWEGPLDHHVRSTTLNGHQAVLDEDGMFRAVISHRDPGVPNWLDAAGRHKGLLQARYYGHENSPTARLTRVPFREVRKHLPADTPAITPEQRSESLRRRMLAVARRRAL